MPLEEEPDVVVADLCFGVVPVKLYQPRASPCTLRPGIMFHQGGETHHVAYAVVAQGEWLRGSINWVSKGEDRRVSGSQECGAHGMGSRNQQRVGRLEGTRRKAWARRVSAERRGEAGLRAALLWDHVCAGRLEAARGTLLAGQVKCRASQLQCLWAEHSSRAGTALCVLASMRLPPLTACGAQAIASTAADSATSSPRAPEKEVHPGEMHPWE
ncbi:Arylacetamide Deacetylase-Like 3 [Manis pentadactyla]|nr:Arylacetamide Deacetylase-Like 3 [Manis pentadactyla]